MTGAFISGVGWVTAGGIGTGRGDKPFSWDAGPVPSIKRPQVFADPHPHFGRLDRYSRLGMAAIAAALRDAGMEKADLRDRATALVAATVYGCLDTDISFLDSARHKSGRDASPHLFAYTLSNTFLGEAAIEFGFTGATYLVNEMELTGAEALRIAASSILEEEGEIAASGICDLGAPPLLGTGNGRPGALFFAITRSDSERSYGRLVLKGRDLFFEGRPVNDMKELAKTLSGG
jgi:3-oxoacyl-[acyl-carrier-protein] synthase II